MVLTELDRTHCLCILSPARVARAPPALPARALNNPSASRHFRRPLIGRLSVLTAGLSLPFPPLPSHTCWDRIVACLSHGATVTTYGLGAQHGEGCWLDLRWGWRQSGTSCRARRDVLSVRAAGPWEERALRGGPERGPGGHRQGPGCLPSPAHLPPPLLAPLSITLPGPCRAIQHATPGTWAQLPESACLALPRCPLLRHRASGHGTERGNFRGKRGERFPSVSPGSTVAPQCMSPDKLKIQSADHLGPHDLRLGGTFFSSVL